MTGYELDAATVKVGAGHQIVAMWSYTLDTSDDDAFPFVSYGQLLLRDDGAVFQRVHHSRGGYGEWDEAPRAHFGQPYTVADVQKEYNYWDTDYSLERIALPGDSPVT